MRAHIIENGIITNTIEVESLDFMPGLIEATVGGPGWLYDGINFSKPTDSLIKQAESIRADRDNRLADTDWTQLADAPVDKEAWATYRQALRDVPAQEGFPEDVVWPEIPE